MTGLARLAPAAAAVLALAGLLALAVPAADAADRIEGTWHFAGGKVLVEPIGEGGFKGTVVQATRFAVCDHPKGQRMWEIERDGGAYRGTHVWYTDDGCVELPGGPAIWRVREEANRFLLDFCTTRPGTPPPSGFGDGECSALERAKPPVPPAPHMCSGAACLEPPPALTRVGCLPRSFRHTFRVRPLTHRGRERRRGDRRADPPGRVRPSKRSRSRRGSRRASVRSVIFRLDGRRIGSDRRPPFNVRVSGSRLRPGRHVLRATVKLRSTRTGRTYRRTLTYRFRACER